MLRIPFTARRISRVVVGAVALTALFLILAFLLSASTLTVLLNGIFIGTLVAIIVTYWELIWQATLGINPYDRVRQMILGFALCWVAIILSVLIGIQFRMRGIDVNSTYLMAASRYASIIAAVLQVSAPDFGLGWFHGRERKALWSGIFIGSLIGLGTILAQNFAVLD